MLPEQPIGNEFLSTPSARRATAAGGCSECVQKNFYPRPPRGGRRCGRGSASKWRNYFYPRPPRGGRRNGVETVAIISVFLSTPSARRATHEGRQLLTAVTISIHALREEGDRSRQRLRIANFISIHALREEGDERTAVAIGHAVIFLSTPSARRATEVLPGDTARVQLFLSTPSARRATSATFSLTTIRLPFLSTPSARRATGDRRRGHQKHQDFYPRPPRGGRPSGRRGWRCTSCYFYPRPPRGGRPSPAAR